MMMDSLTKWLIPTLIQRCINQFHIDYLFIFLSGNNKQAVKVIIAAYRPGVLFPLVRICGCGLERGSAQDPPVRDSYRDSESPPAEVVLF